MENLGQVSVQALLVDIEDVEPHADRGIIDFDSVTPRGILRVATRLHVDSRLHSGKYHREKVILFKAALTESGIAEVSLLNEYPDSDVLLFQDS